MLIWGSRDLHWLVRQIIACNISQRDRRKVWENPYLMSFHSVEVKSLCTACTWRIMGFIIVPLHQFLSDVFGNERGLASQRGHWWHNLPALITMYTHSMSLFIQPLIHLKWWNKKCIIGTNIKFAEGDFREWSLKSKVYPLGSMNVLRESNGSLLIKLWHNLRTKFVLKAAPEASSLISREESVHPMEIMIF